MTDTPNPMKLAVLGMSSNETKIQTTDVRSVFPKPAGKTPAISKQLASRDNKRHVGGFFDPVVSKQLKILAAESDQTIQSLLAEALNDLFNKHGKSSVA